MTDLEIILCGIAGGFLRSTRFLLDINLAEIVKKETFRTLIKKASDNRLAGVYHGFLMIVGGGFAWALKDVYPYIFSSSLNGHVSAIGSILIGIATPAIWKKLAGITPNISILTDETASRRSADGAKRIVASEADEPPAELLQPDDSERKTNPHSSC